MARPASPATHPKKDGDPTASHAASALAVVDEELTLRVVVAEDADATIQVIRGPRP